MRGPVRGGGIPYGKDTVFGDLYWGPLVWKLPTVFAPKMSSSRHMNSILFGVTVVPNIE